MTAGNILCCLLLAGLGIATAYRVLVAEFLALFLILVAGIPHGAFDLHWARRKWPTASSFSISARYLAIGASMSLMCLLLPLLGLVAFLVLSAIHFVEGELPRSRPVTALCIGLASIVLPISFHLQSAGGYLSYFLSAAQFQAVVPLLSFAGPSLFLLCLTLVGIDAIQGRRSESVQRLLCLAGWLLLPPLAGFAVWFIGRHSRQHMLACWRRFEAERTSLTDLIVISLLALLLLGPLLLRFDPRDLNQLFAASIILVAGLTLPHMIVTHESLQLPLSDPAERQ